MGMMYQSDVVERRALGSTIADLALFGYTHVAHEGNYDLTPLPAVRAWIDRVAAQDRHIPITA